MVRRESFQIDSGGHRAPIPIACRVGNILFSSGIGGGRDGSTDAAQQAKQMFDNVRQVMEKAGGSPENIVHMTLRLKDRNLREHIDPEWLAMFPNDHSRPARHALADASLGGNALMQCDIVAVFDD